MIKTYFKIAWRKFKTNKIFSLINIIGLSVGLACCMLITLYILNETSYDTYHQNGENIYQVGTTFNLSGDVSSMPNTPAAFGEIMKHDFPEVEQSARLVPLFSDSKTLLQFRDKNGGEAKSFYEPQGYLADSTFFRMFTYSFVEGSPSNALTNPNTIVLNEEIAQKLFGNQSALNKIIHVSSSTNGDHDCIVTGVFRQGIKPSHIDGRFFMGMLGGNIEQYIKSAGSNLAVNNMYYTYLQLKAGSNINNIEARFPVFLDKYAGKDLKALGFTKKQFLVQLKDIHLSDRFKQNVTAPGSVKYLYILGSIAVFILLIACINFMNLSTARSSKRSAEVGIRKVLGAKKEALIRQFLGESVIMGLIAFAFAIGITFLLLPAFNNMSGTHITFTITNNALLIAMFMGLAVIAGLLAGSYPAFYLSSFIPVKVLKGRFTNSLAAASLRKGLVVFQFFISVVLIIASVVIASQMRYMRSTDLGFDKDSQVIIPLRSETAKNIYTALKADLGNQPGIKEVGASAFYPGVNNLSDNLFYKQGQNMQLAKRTRMNYVDFDYLRTLGIKPVAGRIFGKDFMSDTSSALILNETAIKQIGFKTAADAVGKQVYFDFGGNHLAFDVVGVVKDFHYEDLHLPITPYGFRLSPGGYNYMIVHTKQGDIDQVLAGIRNTWRKLNPNEPLEYSFLDEEFQKNYIADQQLSAKVGLFTAVAIFISCLGLFGLASFSAEQRIKEIGVRKVLGASVTNIVALLSKDFLLLVGIAVVIASPVAWFVMHGWLQSFAYRVGISWLVFVITTFAALFIALATISFQAIRAALSNPVKNLRTE